MTNVDTQLECLIEVRRALRKRRREHNRTLNDMTPKKRRKEIFENRRHFCFYAQSADETYPSLTSRHLDGSYLCLPRVTP